MNQMDNSTECRWMIKVDSKRQPVMIKGKPIIRKMTPEQRIKLMKLPFNSGWIDYIEKKSRKKSRKK